MSSCGPAPLDPKSELGQKEVQSRTLALCAADHPEAAPSRLKLLAKWTQEIFNLSVNHFTVQGMAEVLDRDNSYVTRGRRAVEKFVQQILQKILDKPDQLVDGTHYHGSVRVTKKGAISMGCKDLCYNKSIEITMQGAFVLFGELSENRANFLNMIWSVLQHAHQVFQDMVNDLQSYQTELAEEKLRRKNVGMDMFVEAVSRATGLPAQEAQLRFINHHKAQYPAYFMGRTATDAFREAGLIEEHQKAGLVHAKLSPHGQVADAYRLSTNAQCIMRRLREIQALGTVEEKIAMCSSILAKNTAHFKEHKTFELPGLSDDEDKAFKEQAEAFTNIRPQPPKRRRIR